MNPMPNAPLVILLSILSGFEYYISSYCCNKISDYRHSEAMKAKKNILWITKKFFSLSGLNILTIAVSSKMKSSTVSVMINLNNTF